MAVFKFNSEYFVFFVDFTQIVLFPILVKVADVNVIFVLLLRT